MRRTTWTIALLVGLGLVTPAYGGDAKDAYDEKTSEAKKDLRDLEPGDKTAEDHKDDAKDTAKAASAKTKRQARKAKRKVQAEASAAKREVKEATR